MKDNTKNIFFDIYKLIEVFEQHHWGEIDDYVDTRFERLAVITLSNELKLPNDFDRNEDLPFNISDKIYDTINSNENFILELIKAYKDYKNRKIDWEYYKTSFGDIKISDYYSYTYDGPYCYYSCHGVYCYFPEEDCRPQKNFLYG